MKKLGRIMLFLILCAATGTVLHAEGEDAGMRLGVQMYSDSMTGLLVYADSFELGLRAQVRLYDSATAEGDMNYGGHLAYHFRTAETASAISLGIDGGSYLGDISYKEYIDIGIRLGFNQALGRHILLSAQVFPLYISTREVEDSMTWTLTATFLRASVAVAYLF